MPIKFRCPHCQQFLGISKTRASVVTDCPLCGRSIRIPDIDGTVQPVPEPRLDLQDEALRAALGHLTNSAESPQPTTDTEVPMSVSASTAVDSAFELEAISPEEKQSEFVAVPIVPYNAPQQDPFVSANTLTELAESAAGQLPPDQTLHHSARFSLLQTLGAAFCAFLVGLILGSFWHRPQSPTPPAQNSLPDVVAASVPLPDQPVPPATAVVHGRITYQSATGQALPDKNARILLLPVERQGTAKIAGSGFRIGADQTDQQLLHAGAKVLRGSFALADENGHFQITPPAHGRFGLLIASTYQSRPESIPIAENCRKFLASYFDRPDQIIGNVEYQYLELTLEPVQNLERNVEFSSR